MGHIRKHHVLFSLLLITLLSIAMRFYEITSLGATYEHIRMATWLLGGPGVPTQYDPPAYNTLVAIAFYIFGVHDYVAVGVSGFFGVLTVIAVYFLCKELYNEKTGIMAALLLAVTEYHIMWSRLSGPYSTLTFFFILAMLFFVRAFKSKKMSYYLLFGVFWGFSSLTKYVGVTTPGAVALVFLVFYYYKNRKDDLRESLKIDARGYILSALTVSVINVPWIVVLGIGALMSPERAYFSISNVSHSTIVSNFPLIIKSGIQEYIRMHMHIQHLHIEYLITAIKTPLRYSYYPYLLVNLVSPVILLLAIGILLGGRITKHVKLASEQAFPFASAFLFLWIFFFLTFFTFIVSLKGSRMILATIPAVAILAAHGLDSLKSRKLFNALLLLAVLSGIAMSLDTIAVHHDGYRNAALFLKENTSNDLIFHTVGVATLLFYFENGSWWDPDKYGSVENVTVVVLDHHKYREYSSEYIRAEKIENELTPVAVFESDCYFDLCLDIKNVKDYGQIKIYRVNGTGNKYLKY